ncbi:MAG: glutamate-cysteine ligase family protein [Gemmatimonadaceae bacterium]
MTLTRPTLIDDLRRHAFAPSGSGTRRVGAEVELIPVDAATRRPASIHHTAADTAPATLPVLERLSRCHGWTEVHSPKAGVPEFHTPDGGRITFEPGGQIEFSAPPAASLTTLLDSLGRTVGLIRDALGNAGIDTLSVGVEPLNAIEDVPLQLSADRYRRMDAHFAHIGPHGARMMRQTASIQLCVDNGPSPTERWRLLNALTPYLVATFANSAVYEGTPTGHQSTRRGIWGALDPARTGLPIGAPDVHVAEVYADFALGAASLFAPNTEPPFPAFGARLREGDLTLADWHTHLTTLFPEVRPRGYFEVRSCDALPPAWYAAPLVMVTGLVYGPDGGRSAMEIAGSPDPALLARAGRCGVDDPQLAARSLQLAELGIAECAQLGPAFASDEVLETATAYFQRFTRRHRSPSHDVLTPALA